MATFVEGIQQLVPIKSCDARSKLAVVGTKADMLAHDYSDTDISVRKLHVLFLYREMVRYLEISVENEKSIDLLTQCIVRECVPSIQIDQSTWSMHKTVLSIMDFALNLIASAFSLPVPQNVNSCTPDPVELDDATVQTLLQSSEAQAWDTHIKQFSHSIFGAHSPTHKITASLIAKDSSSSSESEVAAMKFVRQYTRIPVPQPRYSHIKTYMIMDRVEGVTLLECWDKLSWYMQFRIACTLRCYVHQLRRLTGNSPGSIDTGIASGHLFDDKEYGPFSDSDSFRIWCEMVAVTAWEITVRHQRDHHTEADLPAFPVLGGKWDLVFTHGDLNLSNVMLSRDGVLWVIDWATAGFYPPWLESVGIEYYDTHAIARRSWSRWRSFIAGSYPQFVHFWGLLLSDVHRFQY
ncbi:hypothetical protein K435DRAFT_744802 [Dendrothele bispora CBS 962.96]|uniref:Aminoglycoside phosphotransferase domain-containing protein n=1 Tax=Dendrothele bispora (strain CBS 962.96) TaxID=1314807 RepID=A0A4S8MRU2_DENBC|nr:hypothetical protein K435DRAFT_744802 [Dendrothele bispora CBS 962.96]